MARLEMWLAPLLAPTVLAAVLLAAPESRAVHEFSAEGLDPAAVELGLRARVGDEVDRWEIEVEGHAVGRYELTLRGPGDAEPQRRTVELSGHTNEDRSRELASTLALIIEAEASDRPVTPAGEPDQGQDTIPALALPVAFVVVEGHVGLGPPRALDPELGVGLVGGAWVLRDHLQPRARVRWSHGWSGALRVHQLSIGLGLAAGAPLGRLWLGGLVMPALKWTRAEQVRAASAWSGGGEVCALAQYRLQRLVVGVRTGVETTFPAVRASGTDDVIRWGHLRWLLVLEVGIGI